MTVGGFAKKSILGSVLSESLTDSTAFRKCLVGGLPAASYPDVCVKPPVLSRMNDDLEFGVRLPKMVEQFAAFLSC